MSEKTMTSGSDASGGLIVNPQVSQKDENADIKAFIKHTIKELLSEIVRDDGIYKEIPHVIEQSTIEDVSTDKVTQVVEGPMKTLEEQSATPALTEPTPEPAPVVDHNKGQDSTALAMVNNDLTSAIEPSNLPLEVPNYRKSIDSSKNCASCKFFREDEQSEEAVTGTCTRYNFTAQKAYTCDAWQGENGQQPEVEETKTDILTGEAAKYEGGILPIEEPPAYDDQHPTALAAEKLVYNNGQTAKQVVDYITSNGFRYVGKNEQGWLIVSAPDGTPVQLKNQPEIEYYLYIVRPPVANETPATPVESAVVAPQAVQTIKSMTANFVYDPEFSQPTSEVPGGEGITASGKLQTAQEMGIPSPQRFAYETAPELSKPHGTIKNYPLYLPSDRIYSKSMRSLGDVVNYDIAGKTYVYTIKLLDRLGGSHGLAVVTEDDLTPRSMKAIKRVKSFQVRSELEAKIMELIVKLQEYLGDVNDRMDVIPPPVKPINQAFIVDVCDLAKSIMRAPQFQDVLTSAVFRRYVRAMQDIEHGLMGAVHIFNDGITILEDGQPTDQDIQKQVYDRCLGALSRANEVLLPQVPLRADENFESLLSEDTDTL